METDEQGDGQLGKGQQEVYLCMMQGTLHDYSSLHDYLKVPNFLTARLFQTALLFECLEYALEEVL